MSALSKNIPVNTILGMLDDSCCFKGNLSPVKTINGNHIHLTQQANFHGGAEIPFGVAKLSAQQVNKIQQVVKEVSSLDWKLRTGLMQLFQNDAYTAGELVRFSQNKAKDDSKYLETLINVVSQKPELCLSSSPIYRIDGLNGGNRILINELNANPIGGYWLEALAKMHQYQEHSLGITDIQHEVVKAIQRHTPKGGVYFHPVRNIKKSVSYSEKLLLAQSLKKQGIHFYMGTLDSLNITKQGVFILSENGCIKVDMVGGLSSPEVFENKSQLLNLVASEKIHCPSSVNCILSLANKGMLVLLTEMLDGAIDPRLIGLKKSELQSLPFPKTYWLENKHGVNRMHMFKAKQMVAKPIDGVGGSGIVFSDNDTNDATSSQIDTVNFSKYLIQERCSPFQLSDQDGYLLEGSVDPFFTFTKAGNAKLLGVLVRGAEPGTLPNLTANIKKSKDDAIRHTFSLGISSWQ